MFESTKVKCPHCNTPGKAELVDARTSGKFLYLFSYPFKKYFQSFTLRGNASTNSIEVNNNYVQVVYEE